MGQFWAYLTVLYPEPCHLDQCYAEVCIFAYSLQTDDEYNVEWVRVIFSINIRWSSCLKFFFLRELNFWGKNHIDSEYFDTGNHCTLSVFFIFLQNALLDVSSKCIQQEMSKTSEMHIYFKGNEYYTLGTFSAILFEGGQFPWFPVGFFLWLDLLENVSTLKGKNSLIGSKFLPCLLEIFWQGRQSILERVAYLASVCIFLEMKL